MRVLEDDREIGTATWRQSLTPEGAKVNRLTLRLRDTDGALVVVTQESVFARDGSPIRKLQTVSRPGDSFRESLSITFAADAAAVLVEDAENRGVKTVPVPDGIEVRAINEFWILRETPEPGSAWRYWRLDLNDLEWVEERAEYVGRMTVYGSTGPVSTHVLMMGESIAYLDDDGNPWRIESPTRILERIEEER